MGKRSQRLSRRRQENNIGCMSGLIRMFYSRHDAKLLLDRKQGSRRHTFSGFTGRGHSRKNSRDFDEIDEDGDNMEECRSRKLTVKRLMEDELGKAKQLKIPNDEVQRILADLGHGVCLDKSATQNGQSKGDQNQSTRTNMASPPGSFDPSGSKCMKESEENELELALADFLGQIHRYQDEWPHKKCKNKSELCAELKFLIQTKLNELNNTSNSLAYEKTPQSKEKDIADSKHLCSSMEPQPGKFRDALEMLSSDTELFLKIFQKMNSNILENIQGYQNREIRTKLQPTKIPGNTDSIEGINSTNQHEATKTNGKESRHIFFWKKERSNRRQTTEGTNCSLPDKKIVILKPNPRRGIDPTVATSSIQAPQLGATENSKFSIKEVRRRFRIVSSESTKEKTSVNEDRLTKTWLQKTTSTIKKDTRQLTEQISEEKDSPSAIIKSSKERRGEFIFYDEAKKHLTELLKDKNQTTEHPELQTSRSLVDSCSSHNGKTEDLTKEESQLGEIPCGTTETLLEKWQCMKEESQEITQDCAELETVHIEEIEKLSNSETISNEWCAPTEQCRQNPSQNMVEAAARENLVEKAECQEPATPRSSVELISQFTPDGNLEKQDQPSPVSVLDQFFHEDDENLETEEMIKGELHADILRLQYTTDRESDQDTFWMDKDVRLGYIKAFLELSELLTDQNLEVWYLEDELISPCLFEELHQGNQIDDSKILFDCICEAVTEIQSKYFRSTPSLSSLKHKIRQPPMGGNLISEINKHVERNLRYKFPSTLDQLVGMDLEDGSWMDLRSESEDMTVVLWDLILDELLEEVVYDCGFEASVS